MKPMNFRRKKEIEIIAWKYNGEKELINQLQEEYKLVASFDNSKGELSIKTGSEFKQVNIGDYIGIGAHGEFLIFNGEKFENEYEVKADVPTEEKQTSSREDKDLPEPDAVEKRNIFIQSNKKIDYSIRYLIIQSVFFLVLYLSVSVYLSTSTRKNITAIIETAYKDAIERESKSLSEKTKIECDLQIQNAKREAETIISDAKVEAQNEAEKAFREYIQRLTDEREK